MIELINVSKSFSGKEVLRDLNVVFEKGKINCIIGSSGSGKSVMMKSMVGLLKVDTGRILYDGQNFSGMDYKAQKVIRREIGMLFQGSALFDSLTVEENVGFPLKMFSDMSSEERRERVNFCLNRVNLVNANKKYPSEISGGMMKRVGIARAIVMNTKYLFCDEPNSGLDPITSRVIDHLIKEITQEYDITTIINTHDMKTVKEIGDKLVFVYKGNIKWKGDSHHIFNTDVPELKEFVDAS